MLLLANHERPTAVVSQIDKTQLWPLQVSLYQLWHPFEQNFSSLLYAFYSFFFNWNKNSGFLTKTIGLYKQFNGIILFVLYLLINKKDYYLKLNENQWLENRLREAFYCDAARKLIPFFFFVQTDGCYARYWSETKHCSDVNICES